MEPLRVPADRAYHDIAAINTALDYAVVRGSSPNAASTNCPAPGSAGSSRVTQHECELISLLGTMSWQALRDAGTLVQEMREGIYDRDLLDEIGRPEQAEVVFDTQKARPYLPVYFSVGFKNPRFCRVAAIDRLSCTWDFPADLQEKGWKVCHFFQGNEPEAKVSEAPLPAEEKGSDHRKWWQRRTLVGRKIGIKVTVQSQRPSAAHTVTTPAEATDASASANASEPGKLASATPKQGETANGLAEPVIAALVEKRELTAIIELQADVTRRGYSRTIAEALRFLIAFGVALAGLLSGAVDQLQKLDLVPATLAIIALGFGADSLKNLLTQAPKKSGS